MHFIRRLLLGCLCVVSMPALALTEITDILPSGAYIRIAVPDAWQTGDDLILYQHGFNMAFDTAPDLGPLREIQLADGYAMAASGFSTRGWAMFSAVADNRDLLARFESQFGAPGNLIAMGGSMGGLIAHKLAESEGFERMAGVYSLCPPAAGARTWDAAFDLRLAYDAICADVGGGELLRGDEPFPWAYNLNDIPEDLSDLLGSPPAVQTLSRINQCTGIALNPLLRTPPQKNRLAKLMAFGQFTNEDFLLTNLAYASFALGDLLRAPNKLAGSNPFTSVGVDYGSESYVARIPDSIRNDSIARLRFRQSNDLFGKVSANLRMLSLHTSRDQLVRPAHQNVLREIYAPERLLSVLVDETKVSHCGFTEAEVTAGWSVLRDWLAGGEPPDVTDLSDQCAALGADACRFNASLDPGRLDDTMRARSAQQPFDAAGLLQRFNISGAWYDPQRSGEGLLVEDLGADQVLVVWFTFPPAGGDGEQAWLIGVGTASAHGVDVPDLRLVRGARFGSAFNPADVQRLPWGSLTLALRAPDGELQPDITLETPHNDLMDVQYQGPENWGSGRRTFNQLFNVGRYPFSLLNPAPDSRPWQNSGTYFDPTRSGEGLFVQQFSNGSRFDSVITWFTFDQTGNPMWLQGVGSVQNNTLSVDLVRPVGTLFGENFNAADVQRGDWGTATLHFGGCDLAALHWQANDNFFGNGDWTLQRLTAPVVVQPCVTP